MRKITLVALVLVAVASPVLAQPLAIQHYSIAAGTPLPVSCHMVRHYVRQFGLVRAEAMAVAAGMTPSQQQQARRCLVKPI